MKTSLEEKWIIEDSLCVSLSQDGHLLELWDNDCGHNLHSLHPCIRLTKNMNKVMYVPNIFNQQSH